MLGLVAYSPTLYRLFCAATGFGGTTQRADSDAGAVSDRVVMVRFDSNVAPGLAWRVQPVPRQDQVHLRGRELVAFYPENLTAHPNVGHATLHVAPRNTGLHFTTNPCF